jgi:GT2 family glycosyltransferase
MVERAIRSALSCEAEGIISEVLVVDDCSSDDTQEKLKHFGDRIKYLKTPKNLGAGGASDFALGEISSQYYARLDSDDFVSRHFVSSLIMVLEQNPSIAIASCDYLLVDSYENPISVSDLSDFNELQNFGAGMVFRTDLVKSAGGYNPELRYGEDLDLHLRLATLGAQRFHYPVALYRRKIHDGNLSSDPEDQLTRKGIINGN